MSTVMAFSLQSTSDMNNYWVKARFLLIPLLLIIVGCPDRSTTWELEEISSFAEEGGDDTDTGMDSDIAVDAIGRVHLVYKDSEGYVRYLRRETDGEWSNFVWVDPTVGTHAGRPKIAVGPDSLLILYPLSCPTAVSEPGSCSVLSGHPETNYQFVVTGALAAIARPLDGAVDNDGDGILDTTFSAVGAGGQQHGVMDLQIAASGSFHYLFWQGLTLRYQQGWPGPGGDFQTTIGRNAGSEAALSVGPEKVHILVRLGNRSDSGDITYASRPYSADRDVTWEVVTVDEAEEGTAFGRKMDIAEDPEGRVHVCYFNKTEKKMYYAIKAADGGFSDPEAVDVFDGLYASNVYSYYEALDGCEIGFANGNVFVFGRANPRPDAPSDDFKPVLVTTYRDRDDAVGSNWTYSAIDVDLFGESHTTFSATVDSFGRRHVAYQVQDSAGSASSDLKYACREKPNKPCSFEYVPPAVTCGDGTCGEGETTASCAADCPASGPICGDGTCNEGESTGTCASDCPASACGNGLCEAEEGETTESCSTDCLGGGSCGDGTCQGSESVESCAADCGGDGNDGDDGEGDGSGDDDPSGAGSASGDGDSDGDSGAPGDGDPSGSGSSSNEERGGCSLIP